MSQPGSTAQVMDGSGDRSIVHARTWAQQRIEKSYESSAITLEEYAEKAIEYTNSSAERNRRKAMGRRISLLRDGWAPLLKDKLKNWLTPEVLAAVIGEKEDNLDISRNPFKHICQELSITYKSPARRGTPDKPEDGERYNEILKGTGFDLFWQQVEIAMEACNEVVIWPEVVEINGEKVIKHRLATGDTVTIISSEADPAVIEAVVFVDRYKTLGGEDKTIYKLWTDKWCAEFEDSSEGIVRTGKVLDIAPETDSSAANPYDMLPQVLIRKRAWQDKIWDVTTGEDLVDLTLQVGIAKALYNYTRKMSGFKQLAVLGLSQDAVPEGILDPGKLLKLLAEKAIVIDWSVDLKAYLDCIMAEELAAAAARGINPERYKQTGNYQTGHGAQLAERGLSEVRIRKAAVFQEAEAQYKRALCTVLDAHQWEGVIPDPEQRLEVEHAPMWYPADPEKQADVDSKMIAMGIESAVSVYRKYHPEATEKKAREAIEKNLEATAWVQEMKVTHNIPDDATKQSLSAEANGALGTPARDNPDNMQKPPGSPPGNKQGEKVKRDNP